MMGLVGVGLVIEMPWYEIWLFFQNELAVEPFIQSLGFGLARAMWYPTLGWLVIQLSLNAGARYLDDLFELGNPQVARDYLEIAVFGGGYPTLQIKDGEVEKASRELPLYRIGGPGNAKVYLRSAALFERPGGESVVYRAGFYDDLHGFERFREAVDLRDYTEKCGNIAAYTRDGIPVKVVDVEIVFRLASGNQARDEKNPYPVDDLALRRVVYGQTIDPDNNDPSPNWVRHVKRLATTEITDFIGQHNLEELMALQKRTDLRAPGGNAPLTGEATREAVLTAETEPASLRRQMSSLFYTQEMVEHFVAAGVDLIWIGVGQLAVRETVTQALLADALTLDTGYNWARQRMIEDTLALCGGWWSENSVMLSILPSAREAKTADAFLSRAGGSAQRYIHDFLRLYAVKMQEWKEFTPNLDNLTRWAVDRIIYLSGLRGDYSQYSRTREKWEPDYRNPRDIPDPVRGEKYFWALLNDRVEIAEVITHRNNPGVRLVRPSGDEFPEMRDWPDGMILDTDLTEIFVFMYPFKKLVASSELRNISPESADDQPGAYEMPSPNAPAPVTDDPGAANAPDRPADRLPETPRPEDTDQVPPLRPVPSLGAIYFWATIDDLIMIQRVQNGAQPGVVVERYDGLPFPPQSLDGNVPGIMEHLIARADFERMLASGELKPWGQQPPAEPPTFLPAPPPN